VNKYIKVADSVLILHKRKGGHDELHFIADGLEDIDYLIIK